MSWIEIFEPGMRHWREEKDRQADHIEIVPAPGPGSQPVEIDLDNMTAVIDGAKVVDEAKRSIDME